MKVEIDIKKLKSINLTPNQYLVIHSLFYNYEYLSLFDETTVDYLVNNGYIRIVSGVFELRTKGKSLFQKENVKDWINEFREIFNRHPGKMGSKAACITKMELFLKQNPDVTKEQIITAATRYVNSQSNYEYMRQADYFISKAEKENGQVVNYSALETTLEEINRLPKPSDVYNINLR